MPGDWWYRGRHNHIQEEDIGSNPVCRDAVAQRSEHLNPEVVGSSPTCRIYPYIHRRQIWSMNMAGYSVVAQAVERGEYGDIVQLVEHLLCKQRVRGSSPLISTIGLAALGSNRPLQKWLCPASCYLLGKWEGRKESIYAERK